MFARGFPANPALALVFLLLTSCGFAGNTPATPTMAAPTGIIPSQTPEPVPTAGPLVLLVGDGQKGVEEALATWAEDRRWAFEKASPEEADGLADRPGLRALITIDSGLAADGFGGIPSNVAVVSVDEQAAISGPRISTVGLQEARYDQAAFLAGLMVGMASDTWSVGLLSATGGEHESIYRAGFIHGLRYACPRCGVVEMSAGSVNPDLLRDKRVDVAFALPGPEAERAVERLEGSNIWIVWLGPPEGIATDQLAGWVAFDPSDSILSALEELLAGEPGSNWPYSAELRSIRFQIENSQAITPGRERFIRRAWDRMAVGELDTGVDPKTGAER